MAGKKVRYDLTAKQAAEFERQMNRVTPGGTPMSQKLALMNMQDFYAPGGKGFFGQAFGEGQPTEIPEGLEAFWEGDLAEVNLGGNRGIYRVAPMNKDFANQFNLAREKQARSQYNKSISSGDYGLHSVRNRRKTPFFIEEGRLNEFRNANESQD